VWNTKKDYTPPARFRAGLLKKRTAQRKGYFIGPHHRPPIRPLFPKEYRNDVQLVATVLSVDYDNAPDITAMNGLSVALHLSAIPFIQPIGGVVVGCSTGNISSILPPSKKKRA
jgi:hypothetical protein